MTPATATFSLARDSLQAHEPQPAADPIPAARLPALSDVRSQVDLYPFWERRWFFITMLVGDSG